MEEDLTPDNCPEDYATIAAACARMAEARTRGELGTVIAQEVMGYSIYDLQLIGGRLKRETDRLPSPYREAVRPYFTEQIFGMHHTLLTMHREGAFRRINEPLKDTGTFREFCRMVPGGCFCWDAHETNPDLRSPRLRFFYYLISGFAMFVLDRPGHPVGMPFPGGMTVESRNTGTFCPIREKERDVTYSICNFCPARQSDSPGISP